LMLWAANPVMLVVMVCVGTEGCRIVAVAQKE